MKLDSYIVPSWKIKWPSHTYRHRHRPYYCKTGGNKGETFRTVEFSHMTPKQKLAPKSHLKCKHVCPSQETNDSLRMCSCAYVHACVHVYVRVHVHTWRSEHNLQEAILSSPVWVLGVNRCLFFLSYHARWWIILTVEGRQISPDSLPALVEMPSWVQSFGVWHWSIFISWMFALQWWGLPVLYHNT